MLHLLFLILSIFFGNVLLNLLSLLLIHFECRDEDCSERSCLTLFPMTPLFMCYLLPEILALS